MTTKNTKVLSYNANTMKHVKACAVVCAKLGMLETEGGNAYKLTVEAYAMQLGKKVKSLTYGDFVAIGKPIMQAMIDTKNVTADSAKVLLHRVRNAAGFSMRRGEQKNPNKDNPRNGGKKETKDPVDGEGETDTGLEDKDEQMVVMSRLSSRLVQALWSHDIKATVKAIKALPKEAQDTLIQAIDAA